MPSQTQNEYIARINKAFDYIENNIGKQFTLQDLAAAANFSKFHFNRIFYGAVGETPFQFITRVRVERAAMMLLMNPKETISEIAFKCGFSDLSIFSRNFKSFFGISASQYRQEKSDISNISQTHSNAKQPDMRPSMYFCSESNTIKWKTNMELNKSVEIKDLPKMTVAYIRHIGPYKGNDKLFEGLWNRLFSWAGPRNLLGGPDFKSLVIYHDDPNVTVEDKLRLSVCITVPPQTKVDGEVGKMEVEAAKYVIARFVLDATQFSEAWQWVYGQWLPNSGYQPDDKPCFEMYPEEPKDGKFTVDICVPVKPL
ncbi:MAG TPA: GyrI-like domain-containing protein [Tenuifilaceae bacterium]|nr:GyrI-like domain-containing protein [Tenuifilaceae bacterium]HPE19166.1 GyrI-like domain-containing protein [Tenuifilaceae bacterium]HPJ45511.1 GyrI-like domain-containing protein [Tenuifilaceae bacterium]HPQ33835.1 GyrI-like domain-containing protein [Tenuifilaceae bacterium]HRX68204.1 GyrI-like domain-containing protein [Tenuifilaceae bacterium]